jgi:hypothetical protein
VARLIYIVLACALAALVAGFVVRTSNVPLLVSCGFSAVSLVLMFRGWSKRLRETGGVFAEDEEQQELEELPTDDTEVAFVEVDAPEATTTAVLAKPKRKRKRPEPAPEISIEMPEAEPEPEPAPVVRKPKAAPRARAVTAHVFVIPGRSRYHAAGCRFVKGDDIREVTEATAKRRGYVACSVCLKKS